MCVTVCLCVCVLGAHTHSVQLHRLLSVHEICSQNGDRRTEQNASQRMKSYRPYFPSSARTGLVCSEELGKLFSVICFVA